MIRVGYPASLDSDVRRLFPSGIELVALPDGLERDIEIEVWIPDPYPTRALRIWPHLRGVRLILCLMAGTDWIPATGPHVTICNARGAHNISTAEWTVSAILAMLKHFPLYFDMRRSADWRGARKQVTAEYECISGDSHGLHPAVMIEELTGKRVLLVGYGAIGQEIERMLAPFHVGLTRVARISRTGPVVHPVTALDALIPAAEIIILILPLNDASHGLMGPRQFERMRQGALLVNAARGPIVQTDALVQALNAGRIRAALDVTDPEPLPPEHPLWHCPNLLITPHVAASSPQFVPRALQIAAEELRRYLGGEPLRNAVQLAG